MKRLTRLIGAMAAMVALVPMYAMAQEDEIPNDPIPVVENPVEQTSSSLIDGFLAMSSESLYLFLIAGVLSFLFAIVARQAWANDVKTLGYVALCFVAGAVYTYVDQDTWATNDWIRRGLTMAVVGTVFYKLYRPAMQSFTTRTDAMLNRGDQKVVVLDDR
jgi:hypothetical protein